MFIRPFRAIGTKYRQVREWSFSRKDLGTQYCDVLENEVFHFVVLSVRGSRAVKPRRVRCRWQKAEKRNLLFSLICDNHEYSTDERRSVAGARQNKSYQKLAARGHIDSLRFADDIDFLCLRAACWTTLL